MLDFLQLESWKLFLNDAFFSKLLTETIFKFYHKQSFYAFVVCTINFIANAQKFHLYCPSNFQN